MRWNLREIRGEAAYKLSERYNAARSSARKVRRFARLWPGAYFTWPSHSISVRMADWILRDHYLDTMRDSLNQPSALFRLAKK